MDGMDHGRRFQFEAQLSVWLVSVVVFWKKKQTLKIAFLVRSLVFRKQKTSPQKSNPTKP